MPTIAPRLRVLGLIVAVLVFFAAVLLAVHDDPSHEVAAGRRATTTRHRRTTTTTRPRSTTSATPTTRGVTTTRLGTTTTRRPGTTTQPPTTTGGGGAVDRLALQQVATLNQPIAFAMRPGDAQTVYIAEKGGRVRSLTLAGGGVTLNPAVVLDLTSKVSTGSEQGLLGIAFAPDGSHLYADYTNTAGDTRVTEFPFSNGRAGAERVVLGVDQPFANHNGGHVVFGPDGMLYIGLGDGGSGGDPQGNGQRLNTHLGKILRIDPRPSGSQAYSVPGDNPFVGRAGAKPEIWHYGLRNPWRFSFDRATGDQWIADVGQNAWEEIDHVARTRRGANFGWNAREGAHAFNGAAAPAGAVEPDYELAHSAGNCSITGGFVYRGAGIRGLAGTYVFADHCRGRLVGASNGALRELGPTLSSPTSFGEDASGELWVLSLGGGVYRVRAA